MRFLLPLLFLLPAAVTAQTSVTLRTTSTPLSTERQRDSSAAAHVLADLVHRSVNIPENDPMVARMGRYYGAAPYIIYHGDNAARNWKDTYNYDDPFEKDAVNGMMERLANTLGKDPAYRITRYHTETESEGTWHVLDVRFQGSEAVVTRSFAFLKSGGRFFLGDID